MPIGQTTTDSCYDGSYIRQKDDSADVSPMRTVRRLCLATLVFDLLSTTQAYSTIAVQLTYHLPTSCIN